MDAGEVIKHAGISETAVRQYRLETQWTSAEREAASMGRASIPKGRRAELPNQLGSRRYSLDSACAPECPALGSEPVGWTEERQAELARYVVMG